MVIVELQESVDLAMTRAAVESRLYWFLSCRRSVRVLASSSYSESLATWLLSCSFSDLRSERVSESAVRLPMMLPSPETGEATTDPTTRAGVASVWNTPRRPESPSRMPKTNMSTESTVKTMSERGTPEEDPRPMDELGAEKR